MIKEDSETKPCTEYIIDISFNGLDWKISRKYKEFCSLYDKIVN
jgi:hypothetical protein